MVAEFVTAALPWIVIGLAAALFAAGAARRTQKKQNTSGMLPDAPVPGQQNSPEENKEQHRPYGVWLCLGTALGAALGAAGVISLSYGVSFGMLLGAAAEAIASAGDGK